MPSNSEPRAPRAPIAQPVPAHVRNQPARNRGMNSNPTPSHAASDRSVPQRPLVPGVRAMGSSFGRMFRVTTFGESHGGGVGCVVDGVPPKLQLTREELQFELDRRRPGQSRITTPRNEEDSCEILSGVGLDGITLGTPIAVLVRNKDHRSQDYGEIAVAYRPSHADATYDMKYGVRAIAGGGRSSARETIGRVAAGAIAKKILAQIAGTEILAYVSQVKDVTASGVDHATSRWRTSRATSRGARTRRARTP